MEPVVLTTLQDVKVQVAPRGGGFWLPFVVAACVVGFGIGLATGFGLPRDPTLGHAPLDVHKAPAAGEMAVTGVAINSMSDAARAVLYDEGRGVPQNSMSEAARGALYSSEDVLLDDLSAAVARGDSLMAAYFREQLVRLIRTPTVGDDAGVAINNMSDAANRAVYGAPIAAEPPRTTLGEPWRW